MKDLRDLKDLTIHDVKPISDEQTTGPPALTVGPIRHSRQKVILNQDNGKFPLLLDSTAQPSQSAAHRDKSREWNVSKQKWSLC